MDDLVEIYPKFIVIIKNNKTNVVKMINVDLAWYEHSLYFWTDGNFGCDCNRSIIFKDKSYCEAECGFSAYTVICAIFPDGTIQAIDDLTNLGE